MRLTAETTVVTIQEMTSQINKMKREVSLPPIVVSLGLIVPHRSPFAEGYPELALPARPV
jgi:hypothetical protein